MKSIPYYAGLFLGAAIASWLGLTALFSFVGMTLIDPTGGSTGAEIARFLAVACAVLVTSVSAANDSIRGSRRTAEAKRVFASADETRHFALAVHAAGGEIRVSEDLWKMPIEIGSEYHERDRTFVYRTKEIRYA